MRRILVFTLLFFVCFSFAQVEVEEETKTNEPMLVVDSLLSRKYQTSSQLHRKQLPDNFQSKYETEEFDYTLTKPRQSLLDKIGERWLKTIDAIFGRTAPINAREIATWSVRILSVLVIGFVLFFIIKILVLREGNLIFTKHNKKINIPKEEFKENIHEINFTKQVADFELNKQYRWAVRYRFLYVLKLLSDKKLIQWNTEKTNQDYLKEIKNSSQKKAFQELIYIFENIWYGEFPISKTNYEKYKQKFEQFPILNPIKNA